MKLRLLRDTDVSGKTILYRSPYDIGVIENDKGVYDLIDDARIRATIPTLEYLLEQKCKIVIITYVKRPDGKVVEKLRTKPHAQRLAELLHHDVEKLDDCVGEEVQSYIQNMSEGEIVMLENTRFHPGEKEDDDAFAKELAKNGEMVVFDAFPQSHRSHASVTGIMRHLPSVAGFYLEKEVEVLTQLTQKPEHPFVVIIGGAKISDKIGAIENLYQLGEVFLVGGGVSNVFLASEGKEMGDSYMEETSIQNSGSSNWQAKAKELLEKENASDSFSTLEFDESVNPHKIVMPYDLVVTDDIKNPQKVETLIAHKNINAVPDGMAAVDIGPISQKVFSKIISQAKTIFWNGPMGLVEDDRFRAGTKAIAEAIKNNEGTTIIGGGDTVASVEDVLRSEDVTYVSLAGGATLEFLAGKKLPALEMLTT